MYKIIPTAKFNHDVEYYIKKKKFRNIGDDIRIITDEIQRGNLIGDIIPNLKISTKNSTYKVRTANTDTNTGQSNGYRIIYYAFSDNFEVYLLTIYYKKEDNRVPSNAEIEQLVRKYCL